MSISRLTRLLIVGSMVAPRTAQPQVPFGLDTSFRTSIDAWYVASALPLEDGNILISGQVRFPGELDFRNGARLHADGSLDLSFPMNVGMGGKLTPWNDRIYAESGNIVRRLWQQGGLDLDFISMSFSPYFSPMQGGDYHVFPDGRVLISGRHLLSDSIRGYMGPHCLCWFSNEGYLDTTRVHRKCSGVLTVIKELPNGQFMGSGTTATYDDQPAGNIFRFHADGSLDPNFQANVTWGEAFDFLALGDGRVYAAGLFTITGVNDTLQFVRFLPDGSLDPAFNNSLHFQPGELTASSGAIPSFIYKLDEGRLIVTGGFQYVEGSTRKGLCAVDTMGNLLAAPFADCGGGSYQYQNTVLGSVRGIIPGSSGLYIWGSFHGYDDGATNDTSQRMICRLYGLDVGVQEPRAHLDSLSVFPNPSVDVITVPYHLPAGATDACLSLRDVVGREVRSARVHEQKGQLFWDIREIPPGTYSVTLLSNGVQLRTEKLIIRQ